MPRAKKHLLYGAMTLPAPLSLLLFIYHFGCISIVDFLKFVFLGGIALLIGSDLPDIDARSAPIHEGIGLVIPPAVFWGSVYFIGLDYIAATALTAASITAFFKLLPKHRGFIHSVRVGCFFGCLISLLIYFLWFRVWLSLWTGVSLLMGYLIHLLTDEELKI